MTLAGHAGTRSVPTRLDEERYPPMEASEFASVLDAVRTFAADWEAVQAHNREAFSRGRIGYMKDAPTLDRLQAIINGGAA